MGAAIMQTTITTKIETTLSPGCVLQWIHETAEYERRYRALDVDGKRRLLAKPITRFDVENTEAMVSIFEQVEDEQREAKGAKQ